MTAKIKPSVPIKSIWELPDAVVRTKAVAEGLAQAMLDEWRPYRRGCPTIVAWRLLLDALDHPDNRHALMDPSDDVGAWHAMPEDVRQGFYKLRRPDWNDLVRRTFGSVSPDGHRDIMRKGVLKHAKDQGLLDWSRSTKTPNTVIVRFSEYDDILTKAGDIGLQFEDFNDDDLAEYRAACDKATRYVYRYVEMFPGCMRLARSKHSDELNMRIRHLQIQPYVIWATGGYDVNPHTNPQPSLKIKLLTKKFQEAELELHQTHSNFKTQRRCVKTLCRRLGFSKTTFRAISQRAAFWSNLFQGELIAKGLTHTEAIAVAQAAKDEGKPGIRIIQTNASIQERAKAERENRDNTGYRSVRDGYHWREVSMRLVSGDKPWDYVTLKMTKHPTTGEWVQLENDRTHGQVKLELHPVEPCTWVKTYRLEPRYSSEWVGPKPLPPKLWAVYRERPAIRKCRAGAPRFWHETQSAKLKAWFEERLGERPEPRPKQMNRSHHHTQLKLVTDDKGVERGWRQNFEATDTTGWWSPSWIAKIEKLVGKRLANPGVMKLVTKIPNVAGAKWRPTFCGVRLPYKPPGSSLGLGLGPPKKREGGSPIRETNY